MRPQTPPVEAEMAQPVWRAVRRCLSKPKMLTCFDGAIASLGTYPLSVFANVYGYIVKKLKATYFPPKGDGWTNQERDELRSFL